MGNRGVRVASSPRPSPILPVQQEGASSTFEYTAACGERVRLTTPLRRRAPARSAPRQGRASGAQRRTVSDDEVKAFYVARTNPRRSTGYGSPASCSATGAAAGGGGCGLQQGPREGDRGRLQQGQGHPVQAAAAVKVRVITVPLPPGSTPEQEQARRRASTPRSPRWKAGKTCPDAKEKSEDASTKTKARSGLRLPRRSPYGATLEEQAQKLKPVRSRRSSRTGRASTSSRRGAHARRA